MSFLNAERVNVTLLAILETIFPPRESEVIVREATRDAVARLMTPQSIHLAPEFTSSSSFSVTALLPYRSEFIQSLILEAKFHTNVRAHALLGEIVALYIKNLNLSPKDVVIIPLPLGTKRRKLRGYNQVEEIAKYACRYIDASLRTDILVRVRETVPQMTLGREARLRNMRGTFGAAHPHTPPNPSLTYILLDDVVTTGATLRAGYEALITAGARDVMLLALAH